MKKKYFEYLAIRFLGYFFRFFPYKILRFLGKILGSLSYYLLSDFRKTALSNLAMAKNLQLSNSQIRKIAKESFQNIAINCLELFKIAKEKNLSRIVQCENPGPAQKLIQKGIGIVFFCAHQSNWDLLFLDGNLRMAGIAIGKPFSNPYLYRWIKSLREKTGGEIISPKQALKIAIPALKNGKFVGIVGDQADLNSNYQYPLFGRMASNTLSPAIFAYRTNCPLIFATTRRVKNGYKIHYSDPIWPNQNISLKIEARNMMDQAMKYLEKSIIQSPGEWLWLHNRWKMQSPRIVYKEFRYDAICLILDEIHYNLLKNHLPVFRKIYPNEHITLWIPKGKKSSFKPDECFEYTSLQEVKKEDYRFKLVLNFTEDKSLQKHFLRLGALHTYNWQELQMKGYFDSQIQECILRAMTRPHTLQSELL